MASAEEESDQYHSKQLEESVSVDESAHLKTVELLRFQRNKGWETRQEIKYEIAPIFIEC